MRRIAILALAATAATAVVVVFATSGSAQQPGGRTLTFIESNRGSTFNFVDNPPKTTFTREGPRRVSMGDELVFTQPLLNQAMQRVGRIYGTCMAMNAGRFDRIIFSCRVIARLADGDIATNGLFKASARIATLAVVGGTGAYEGARGSLVHDETKRPNVDTVHLLP